MSILNNRKSTSKRKAAKVAPSVNFVAGPFEARKGLVYGLVEEEPYGTMMHIIPEGAKPFRVGIAKAERIADAVLDARKRS